MSGFAWLGELFKLGICIGLCGMTLLWLARRAAPDRWLVKCLLGSFALRIGFAFALYAISYWRLPMLSSLQMDPGFWAFSLDSFTYHYYGHAMAGAWLAGTPVVRHSLDVGYFFVIAVTYLCWGPNPLYPIAFNCFFGALSGLIAYLIGRRVYGRTAGRISAVLVGFWPSSIMWSSQLLKDTLANLLMLVALHLMMESCRGVSVRRVTSQDRAWLLRLATLWIVTIALGMLRPTAVLIYCALAWMMVFVVLIVILRFHLNRRFQRLTTQAAIGVVMGLAFWATFSIDTLRYGYILDNNPCAAPTHAAAENTKPVCGAAWKFPMANGEIRERRWPLLPESSIAAVTVWLETRRESRNPHRTIGFVFSKAPAAQVTPAVRPLPAMQVPDVSVLPASGPPVRHSVAAAPPDNPPQLAPPGVPLSPPVAPVSVQPPVSARRPSDTHHVIKRRFLIGQHLARLANGIFRGLRERREGYINTGGHFLMDQQTNITTFRGMVTYIPRALFIGLFSPFPTQWFDVQGTSGKMKLCAIIEMTLFYGLFFSVLRGMVRILRRCEPAGLFLLAAVAAIAVPMSLVVVNIGTLFRLRLQFVLPLLIVAAVGDPVGSCTQAAAMIRRVIVRGR